MENFSSSIAQGVHALAQPLTVMRMALLSCKDREMTETDSRTYVSLATDQLERVCSIFGYLQQFVAAEQNAVVSAPQDVSMILEAIVENQNPIFQKAAVNLEFDILDILPSMAIDMDRTVQAVLAILTAASSISSKGDTVRLRVSRQEEHVRLKVWNRSATGKHLAITERLALTLGELNVLAQKGDYHLEEEPFSISMRLPIHAETFKNEVNSTKLTSQQMDSATSST